MSIISNFTAEPNRVEMMLDYLKNTKRQYTKDELENLFSPPNGKRNEDAKGSTFKEVFTIVESLGLIQIKDDQIILNLPDKKRRYREIIKEAIFNSNFILNDKFAYAVAWLQTQKSIENLGWQDVVKNTINQDLNDSFSDFDLTNNSRWQHFGYWCIYIGLANKISISDKDYICPDPTEAISNELEYVFKDKKELPIKDVMNRLSKTLPILELGHIRKDLNESIREGLYLTDNQLSFATSLAFFRLEERKQIKLHHKSDAESMSLQNGDSSEVVSHIIYLGK